MLTSANMIAIAVMASVAYGIDVLNVNIGGNADVWRNNTGRYSDDNHIRTELFREDFGYYNSHGLEDILERSHLEDNIGGLIKENIFKGADMGFSFIPLNKKDYFRSKSGADKMLPRVLRQIERISEVSFLDIQNDEGPEFKKVMDNSHQVVIIMPLDKAVKQRWGVLDKKKTVLIGIGGEEKRKLLEKTARFHSILKENVCLIPVNPHFNEYAMTGGIAEYIKKGVFISDINEDFEFMSKLLNATNIILRNAGYEV